MFEKKTIIDERKNPSLHKRKKIMYNNEDSQKKIYRKMREKKRTIDKVASKIFYLDQILLVEKVNGK